MVKKTKNKKPAYNAGDPGSTPGSGRSPEGGHGNPPQHSCLENPMGREAWGVIIHRVTNCWTQLRQLSMHAHIHFYKLRRAKMH